MNLHLPSLLPLLFMVPIALLVNLAVTKSWSHPDIFMGARIPRDANRENLRPIAKRFTAMNVLTTLFLLVVGVLCLHRFPHAPQLMGLCPILYLILTFCHIVPANRRVRELYPQSHGPMTITVDTQDLEERPKPFSLKLYAIPIAIGLLFLLFLAVSYKSLPEEVPLHFGLNGPDQFTAKTPVSVFVGGSMPLFFGVVFLFAHYTVFASTRRMKNHPYPRLFHWSLFLFATLMSLLSVLMFLVFFGFLPQGWMKPLIILMPIAALLLPFGLLATTRHRNPPEDVSQLAPDDYWRLGGTIYVNPKDPALFVPKRMGIGTTMNFGHWQAYAILLGPLVLLLLAFCLPFLH